MDFQELGRVSAVVERVSGECYMSGYVFLSVFVKNCVLSEERAAIHTLRNTP